MENSNINEKILEHAINGIVNINENSTYGCDLHGKLFNEDYFIIGYDRATEFLENCEDGIFGAIQIIKEYEEDTLGEVNTDFSSSEKVANMYAYIKGEKLLNESKVLQKNCNNYLTKKNLKDIKNELEKLRNKNKCLK
jgi:hypothetical protein